MGILAETPTSREAFPNPISPKNPDTSSHGSSHASEVKSATQLSPSRSFGTKVLQLQIFEKVRERLTAIWSIIEVDATTCAAEKAGQNPPCKLSNTSSRERHVISTMILELRHAVEKHLGAPISAVAVSLPTTINLPHETLDSAIKSVGLQNLNPTTPRFTSASAALVGLELPMRPAWEKRHRHKHNILIL